MIIDLKYHIASLAAVFLALAIGVITGTVMLGNDTIVWQQEKMTDSLESEISVLREDNRQLHKETVEMEKQAQLNTRFEESVLPQLIDGRLTGMKVVVIDTCSGGRAAEISQVLAQSGARVEAMVELLPAYGGTAGIPNSLTKTAAGKQTTLGWEQVSRKLAAGILAGAVGSVNTGGSTNTGGSAAYGGSSVLPVLQESHLVNISWVSNAPGMISTAGTSENPEVTIPKDAFEEKVDVVVILGGAKRKELPRKKFEYTDIPMIKYFKEQGVRVVGVETDDSAVSYIPHYKKLNLTTIDNVNTIAGKLSLVMAVEGSQGTFGTKSTAQKLSPLE